MAKNVNNKYPADKTGSKYSEFRNTKRFPPGKTRAELLGKQTAKSASGGTDQAAGKTS